MSIWEQRRFKYPIVSGLKVPDFGRQFFQKFCSITKDFFNFCFVNFPNMVAISKICYLLCTVSSSNNNRLAPQCDRAMTASSLFQSSDLPPWTWPIVTFKISKFSYDIACLTTTNDKDCIVGICC